jgi:hypothetical protein
MPQVLLNSLSSVPAMSVLRNCLKPLSANPRRLWLFGKKNPQLVCMPVGTTKVSCIDASITLAIRSESKHVQKLPEMLAYVEAVDIAFEPGGSVFIATTEPRATTVDLLLGKPVRKNSLNLKSAHVIS